MLRVTHLTGFGSSGVDATPPTITSDDEYAVDSGDQLAFSIVTDVPATLALSGADAADFELADNDLATTHTLRWLGDGTQSTGSPADADTDNVYEVTITPANGLAIDGVPQNLAVTVNVAWTDTFTCTLTSDGAVNNENIRVVILNTLLTNSGSSCRLCLEHPRSAGFHALVIDDMYISEKAASGDPYDFVASPAPTQITVGGLTSFTLATNTSGQQTFTDTIAFAIDETKNYVISFHVASFGTNSAVRRLVTLSGATTYSKFGASDSSTTDAALYVGWGSAVAMITKIQVP